MKSSKIIRKELTKLRYDLIQTGVNENEALNIARQKINEKYGKGWRESDYKADSNLKMSYY